MPAMYSGSATSDGMLIWFDFFFPVCHLGCSWQQILKGHFPHLFLITKDNPGIRAIANFVNDSISYFASQRNLLK